MLGYKRSVTKKLPIIVARYAAALAAVCDYYVFLYVTLIDLTLRRLHSRFCWQFLEFPRFGGLRFPIFMSVAATLAYNYFFLPPTGTFTIADPQNWVALVHFPRDVSARQRSGSARAPAKPPKPIAGGAKWSGFTGSASDS